MTEINKQTQACAEIMAYWMGKSYTSMYDYWALKKQSGYTIGDAKVCLSVLMSVSFISYVFYIRHIYI